MSSTPADVGRSGFRFRPWLTLATVLALAVLVSLGTWQLQRLAWKTDLIERATERLAGPPEALPPAVDDAAALDFRRIAVRGIYLHDQSVTFGYSVQGSEPGGRLLTPLRLEDGRTLLVDRGWLPEELPPNVPEPPQPTGLVELSGVLRYRGAIERTWLTPEDDPAGRRWFTLDPEPIGAALGLDLMPFVLVLEASEGPAGLPRAAPVAVNFRNDHLGYALTWYGLAAGLVVIYLLVSFSRPVEQRP